MDWLDRRSGTLIVQGYFRYPVQLRDGASGNWIVMPYRDCLPNLDAVLEETDGAIYVALNSFNTDRWLAHPEANPKCTALIQRVLKEGRLEAEMRKPFASYGYHNPDIQIYRLK